MTPEARNALTVVAGMVAAMGLLFWFAFGPTFGSAHYAAWRAITTWLLAGGCAIAALMLVVPAASAVVRRLAASRGGAWREAARLL